MTTTLPSPAEPTTTPRAAVTGDDLVARITELAPRFRERAAATAEARTVPAQTVAELRAAGMTRLLVPADRGGLGLGVRTMVDAVAAAAAGCASTGWLAGLMAHTNSVVSRFPLAAQQDVWRDGTDVVLAGSIGVTAEPVDGGYRLTGRSPFASGVNNASWVYIIGTVPNPGGPPEPRLFLVDRAQYTVVDTWHVSGMRGTGSNTVVTDGAFVPHSHSISQVEAREGTVPGGAVSASHIVTLPWVATGALVFAAAMTGAARGVHADVTTALRAKRGPSGARTVDSEHVQQAVALAAGQIDAATAVLHGMAGRADDPAPFTLAERARVMRDGAVIADLVVRAVDALVELHGTAAFGETSAVQRAWADVHFAAAHQGLNPRLAAAYAGALDLEAEQRPRPMFY